MVLVFGFISVTARSSRVRSAKITLAIFFAGYLATHRDLILVAGRRMRPINLPRLLILAPVFLAWIVSLGVLVFQKDLGSAIMFFSLFVACCTCRPVVFRGWWLRVSVWLWVAISRTTMSRTCMPVFMRGCMLFDPEIYQASPGGSGPGLQGRFGLAYGGLFWPRFGVRTARTSSPYANSDMIISSLGEELGLVGLGAI